MKEAMKRGSFWARLVTWMNARIWVSKHSPRASAGRKKPEQTALVCWWVNFSQDRGLVLMT